GGRGGRGAVWGEGWSSETWLLRGDRPMNRLIGWAAVRAVGVLAGEARPAAPPARLTAEQEKIEKQSDELLARAESLRQHGKPAEAVEAARQGLALEREVHGQVRFRQLNWLAFRAGPAGGKGDWAAARRRGGDVR